MLDPQQELFTRLKLNLEALGYSVYDGFLPPEDTAYPFVYLADNQLDDVANKSAVFGEVSQTIHVWHSDPGQRGTVSQMLLNIKATCRKIEHTNNFTWLVRSISQQILPDATTKPPLVHGILTVDYKFS